MNMSNMSIENKIRAIVVAVTLTALLVSAPAIRYRLDTVHAEVEALVVCESVSGADYLGCKQRALDQLRNP